MNTIQLECFISVAEHLNFSRASEELKITQPAVSHQIRTLEQELDVKLFRRTSKSVSLTQEGMMFLPDAQIILKTALSAKERLGRKEHVLPLDIGCHNHMEMNLLPPVFHDLVKEFPFLRPGIHLVPFPSLLGQVVNRQIHAAFGVLDPQRKVQLDFHKLCSIPISCICTPDHPFAEQKALTEKDFIESKNNIIVCSPRHVSSSLFSVQNHLLSQLPPEQRYFADGIESALVLAKAKMGYTLYPDMPQIREPGLVYIPIADLPMLSFGVFYQQSDDYPVMKRFLRLLQDFLQKDFSS